MEIICNEKHQNFIQNIAMRNGDLNKFPFPNSPIYLKNNWASQMSGNLSWRQLSKLKNSSVHQDLLKHTQVVKPWPAIHDSCHDSWLAMAWPMTWAMYGNP